MGRKLTIPYYRPPFVLKGSLSDVGDGTAWPIQVTVDQLAEIMFRVRDARFTSGSFVTTMAGGDSYTIAPQGTPPAALVALDSGESMWSARGFFACAPSPSEPLPDEPLSRFGASYEVALPSNTINVKDIASGDELAMWVDNGAFWDAGLAGIVFGVLPGIGEPSPFRTGLDCYFAAGVYPLVNPSFYGVYGVDNDGYAFISEVGVNITGVAWVDLDASGDPFSPDNELYLGIKFEAYHVGTPAGPDTRLSTDFSIFGANPYVDAGIDFQIVLSNSTLSANLYAFVVGIPAPTTSGSNFVLEATQWWPYAHDNGSPTINRFDGTPLPSQVPNTTDILPVL